jgi:hypothetical protein
MMVYGELGGSSLGKISEKNTKEIAVRISGVPTKKTRTENFLKKSQARFGVRKTSGSVINVLHSSSVFFIIIVIKKST